MAIYHCSIKIISRGKGQSSIASAAYRSGTKLEDKETGQVFDYTRKSGVRTSGIILAANAPKEFENRETLWNSVEKSERQHNSQVAREIEVALPVELTHAQQVELVRNYITQNFVDRGMCADYSIHDKNDGNPHCHIMLTMRPLLKNGKWASKTKDVYSLDKDGNKIPIIDEKTGQQKIGARGRKMWKREKVNRNEWNDKKLAEEWRKAWADSCNAYLDKEHQIDHRSYARQKVDIVPTIHEGYAARNIERKNGISDRCEENREIRERNRAVKELKEIRQEIKVMEQEIEDEKKDSVVNAYISGGIIPDPELLELDDPMFFIETRTSLNKQKEVLDELISTYQKLKIENGKNEASYSSLNLLLSNTNKQLDKNKNEQQKYEKLVEDEHKAWATDVAFCNGASFFAKNKIRKETMERWSATYKIPFKNWQAFENGWEQIKKAIQKIVDRALSALKTQRKRLIDLKSNITTVLNNRVNSFDYDHEIEIFRSQRKNVVDKLSEMDEIAKELKEKYDQKQKENAMNQTVNNVIEEDEELEEDEIQDFEKFDQDEEYEEYVEDVQNNEDYEPSQKEYVEQPQQEEPDEPEENDQEEEKTRSWYDDFDYDMDY